MVEKRAQEQIDEAIKGLKEQRETLPEFTAFGDSNHEAIDFAIEVLTKNLSMDDIYDRGCESYSEMLGITARNFLDGEVELDELLG